MNILKWFEVAINLHIEGVEKLLNYTSTHHYMHLAELTGVCNAVHEII